VNRIAASALLCGLLVGSGASALPGAAAPPDPPDWNKREDFLDKRIISIEVLGPLWAMELERNLPLKTGMYLSRDRLRRAVLHFHQNAPEQVAQIRVLAEPVVDRRGAGVHVIFRIEPLRRIEKVSFSRAEGVDSATLLRAVNLPQNSDFWPDVVDQSASAVAQAFVRAGWRETQVGWTASPGPEGLHLVFAVHRSAPTKLVRIEFTGEKGLTDPELAAVFELSPGARLSMDAIDDGIVELKGLFRTRHFYRATVGQPVVKTADNLAVVEIPIDAGPRFQIQVRGNRTFEDATLLDQLHYTGEEVLDDSTERDLADRLIQVYELAGFPYATVAVRETDAPARDLVKTTLQPPGADAPIGPPPLIGVMPDIPVGPLRADRIVTFLITEGPATRVVERRFEGDLLRDLPVADLQKRLDIALEDAVPADLLGTVDESMLRAAGLGGSPDARLSAHPHVNPHEVFSRKAYDQACDVIRKLYKAQGYLDVQAGDAYLVQISPGRARAVIPIRSGPQFIVASVELRGVKEQPVEAVLKLVTVHAGDPLVYSKIEETRDAILQFYQRRGYLSVAVDDKETANSRDPTLQSVTFEIDEGKAVNVSGIDVRGAAHTSLVLVQKALKFDVGDRLKPQDMQVSQSNLLALGIFTSAEVTPQSITEPETRVNVKLTEKPSYTVDVSGGLSIVDGPRVAAQFSAAHFLGTNNTFTASAKVDVPIFRYCAYHVITCTAAESNAQVAPPDPVERRVAVGIAFPVFGAPGETPVEQHLDVIAQNMLRPAYFLEKYSILGTLNGLPHATVRGGHRTDEPAGPELHGVEISTLFQAEVEYDNFRRTNSTDAALIETLADQKAVLLPAGPTELVSLRPSLHIDGRDNKLSPTKGGQATLTLDFSQYFDIPQIHLTGTKVALISALLTGGGYIPVYPARRVVLALSGRVGKIFSQPWAQIIGTKDFFLGGTSSMRGFAEDALIPEDVREAYDRSIRACGQLVTGISCQAQTLQIIQNASATGSPGGSFVVAARADLRFAILQSLDGDLFFDAGNLWSNPLLVDLRKLRYSTGFGAAVPLPIGPATIDLGFILPKPDTLVGEAVVQVHFAIGF
jgi:outer membrane protein assembly factor BamA